MGIYETLGVRPVINAAGPLTRMSGAPLHPQVVAAMAEAAGQCARIEDLQLAAGLELAAATGAEAGYVTAGATAGLALASAACLARLDVAAMDRLPDTRGLRNEIIIQRPHLTAYSHALRASGARLIEVGYAGFPGQGSVWPWQIESAISERTAAIAFAAGETPGGVPLEQVVEVARRHGLPVIVDAAAELPPASNLRAFITAGADLVAFSGGKAIGGPQASGLLFGRAELIESVALQQQDMDVYPATWGWRERYLASGRLPGPPHHGLGRSMKVGREEIVGLVVALRRFLARDLAAEAREQAARLRSIGEALTGLSGVTSELREPTERFPTLIVRLNEAAIGRATTDIVNELIEGDPRIAVSQSWLRENALGVIASTLREGEEELVAARLVQVLRR